jgi:cell division protease FtsH
MVAYYGMSDKLKNLSYYDSTGRYDMGITKPYSEKTAEVIDSETSAIIAEQMARAKKILEENAEGHNKLAELLIEKEVITSDDVEAILGPRPWASRTDEIIAANAKQADEKPKKKRAPRKKKEEEVATPTTEEAIPTTNSEQSERSDNDSGLISNSETN